MGQRAAKSANMATEGENSDQVYENIESLGDLDTFGEGAMNEKDSILSEVRQTAGEVIDLMVESVRVQKEILRVLHKNGERLDNIISITGKIPMGRDNNLMTYPETVAGPGNRGRRRCYNCRRIGHIWNECPLK